MQVFELHFNPKGKEDTVFGSFCYEPENIYEKKLGNLYMAGEFSNVLPQNLQFIQRLSTYIKAEYYRRPRFSPEQAFKEALKAANEFLEGEAKNGNVNWLGNLNFAVLQIQDFVLNFSKFGKIRVLLMRGGEMINIGTNIEFQDLEPYPLKVFSNIASGKIALDDRILVVTNDTFSILLGENILKDLALVSSEEQLKKALRPKEDVLIQTPGIALFALIKEAMQPRELFTFQKKPKAFSFSKMLEPYRAKVRKIKSLKIQSVFPRMTFPRIKFFRPKPAKALTRKPKDLLIKPRQWLKSITDLAVFSKRLKKELQSLTFNKSFIFIPILILLLVSGFLIFEKQKEEEMQSSRAILNQVNDLKTKAESALIFKHEELANNLFQEAWRLVLPQTLSKTPLQEEALTLKDSIEKSLAPLNKLEIVAEPQTILDFKDRNLKFIPQKMLILGPDFYLFNPVYSTLYRATINQTEITVRSLESNRNLKLGTVSLDNPVFFSEPNILIRYPPEGEFLKKNLALAYSDFNFYDFTGYQSNLYFLDDQNGEIVKYTHLLSSPVPTVWLKPDAKKAIASKSIATDGNIWILTRDNKIDRYYGGLYEATVEPQIFPYLKKPTKIWVASNLPYLYILEPAQKRIIVLTKSGQVVKQYQSEFFDDLNDFGVSKEGNAIYLLNGMKVYKISFQQ